MRTSTFIANAASDATSPGFDLADDAGMSIHIKFSSGTLVGAYTVQVSNDNSDWISAQAAVPVTAGESSMFNLNGAFYRYVRVFWDATSGTGTITEIFLSKDQANVRL